MSLIDSEKKQFLFKESFVYRVDEVQNLRHWVELHN